MLLSVVTLALLAVSAPQDPEPGTVRGRVLSEPDGTPLSLAVVEILGGGKSLAVPTDAQGYYLLRKVPAGPRLLRARQLGYAPVEMEVLVPPGGDVVVDIALEQQALTLAPVNVRVRSPELVEDTIAAPAPDLAMAAARALESTPGLAELGLGEIAHGVPGQEPVDPSDVLFVRGAVADLKLVLLDGAPVYAPFHLGGLVPSFDADALGSATLYLGGAPARYDGGLSYVMDLQTRSGRNDFHAAGSFDVLSTQALVEGPVGRARFLVAGRAVHGIEQDAVLAGSPRYAFSDGVVRLDAPVGAGSVSFTAFGNREGIQLDSLGASQSQGMARWENLATSLRYRGHYRGTETALTAAFSTFDAQLPIAGNTPILTEGAARRVRLAADLARDVGPVRLRYGASFDRLWLDYHAHRRQAFVADSDPELLDTGARGDAAGAYLDAGWRPMPRLHLRGGLRADVFSLDPAPVLAPRLAATWMLTERAAITLAGGRYHQYARPPDHTVMSMDSVSGGTAPRPPLSVARATHFSLALDQKLTDRLGLGVEAYYKRFDGLPVAAEDRANASGMDLWIRRGGAGITGWLGYSLTWVWASNAGEITSDDFAGRHLLSAGVSGPLGRNGQIAVRFAYGAGLPYTAVPGARPDSPIGFSEAGHDVSALSSAGGGETPPMVPAVPDDPYVRVDLDVSHTWTPEWWGFSFRVTPYLRLLNALGQRDALFYFSEPDTGTRPLSPLPVVPVVGMRWSF